MRIRQRGIDALKANLPSHLFQAFLDTLGVAPTETLVLDEHFERFENPGSGSGEPEDTHIEKSVSRITPRQILLSGLEGILHTGKRFERYENVPDGAVIGYLDDGSAVQTNLLVGANGIQAIASRTYNADAAKDELTKLRIATGEVSAFSRPLPLPDGSQGSIASFRTLTFAPRACPLDSSFYASIKRRTWFGVQSYKTTRMERLRSEALLPLPMILRKSPGPMPHFSLKAVSNLQKVVFR